MALFLDAKEGNMLELGPGFEPVKIRGPIAIAYGQEKMVGFRLATGDLFVTASSGEQNTLAGQRLPFGSFTLDTKEFLGLQPNQLTLEVYSLKS